MRCEHEAVIREGPYKGTMARMEYDTLWAMGPYCGVDKLDAIIKAAELCNYYGLDAQSAGVTVGFVMDCHEKGILTHEDLGGIDAHFGNAEALIQLIEKMGKREGIGDMLADGVKSCSRKNRQRLRETCSANQRLRSYRLRPAMPKNSSFRLLRFPSEAQTTTEAALTPST